MALTYRKGALIFLGAASLGAPLLWAAGRPLAGFAILTVANLAVWIPTVVPNHQWLGRTATSFGTSEGEVWLTIDDGPDPADTTVILELLGRHRAKATFFFVGDRAAACPEAVLAVRDAGHGIGNHTQHHYSGLFWALPGNLLRSEVASCAAALEGILGQRPALFRPPVGMKNPLLQGVLDREGLLHVGWSARGRDGVSRDAAKVLRRITARLRPGAIILLHQATRDGAGRPLAPAVLEGLLCELEKRGLRCVIPPPEALLPRSLSDLSLGRSADRGPTGS